MERENNPTINSVDSVENQAELMQTVCKEKDKKTKGAKADLKLILDAVTIECQQCRKLIKLVETEADRSSFMHFLSSSNVAFTVVHLCQVSDWRTSSN